MKSETETLLRNIISLDPEITKENAEKAIDIMRGKVVTATGGLGKGKEGSEALKEEIKEYVKTHTAPYKYPRIIEFVAELPKTVNGKIRRAAIREQSEAK